MNIDNQLITADSAKRWIEMLQKQLIRENPAALPNDGIDGIYGAETTEWVTRFQERKGLYVDGIAGAETLERLRTDIVFYVGGPSGRGIELLQEDLEYFYLSSGTIDGIYGAGTRQSVRDFQSDNNLFVDGEAGPGTMKKMDELLTTLFAQSGDTGSLVRRIQEQLNEQESTSVSVYVDGIYGSETLNAVTQFQEANDLYVDGIVGPRTMNLLDVEAVHPLSQEEIVALANSRGMATETLSQVEQNTYIEKLEGNPVFFENVDDPNAVLTAGGLRINNNGNKIISVFGMFETNPNVAVFAIFKEDTEELIRICITESIGTLYNDKVKFTTIEADGQKIIDEDNMWVDVEDQNLQLQLEIKEVLEGTQASNYSRFSLDWDTIGCGIIASVAGTATSAGISGLSIVILGGSVPGFAVAGGAVILGSVYGSVFC